MSQSSPPIGEASSGRHSPRPIEKELQSSFDRRIAMLKVGELKGPKVIVKTEICWGDRPIGKTFFILWCNLVQNWFHKLKVCIWDLSPFSMRGSLLNTEQTWVTSVIAWGHFTLLPPDYPQLFPSRRQWNYVCSTSTDKDHCTKFLSFG